jgi:hypothetical protein
MNTFNTLKNQWKKIAVLGALTLGPTLAVTNSAQAAPSRPGPVWNNQRDNDRRDYDRRDNDNRFEHRGNDNRHIDYRSNDGRFDNRDYRYDNRHDDNRFDPRRDGYRYDNRNDYYRRDRRDDDRKNTTKIIGAGVVGAILGAVLSR